MRTGSTRSPIFGNDAFSVKSSSNPKINESFPQVRRTTSSPPSGLSPANLRISVCANRTCHAASNYANRCRVSPQRAFMREGSHVSNRRPENGSQISAYSGAFRRFCQKTYSKKKRIKCDNRLDINELYDKLANDRGEYGCPAKH